MEDKIQIRAGNKAGMPTLTDRELGYVRDENALYIGTPSGNKDINADTKAAVAAMKAEMSGKLTAGKVAAQASVEATADSATIAAALNSLIAAMKSSGVMNT